MKMLRDDHVIRFFGQRTSGSVHYLFLEYADGGELFDRIGVCVGVCVWVWVCVCVCVGVCINQIDVCVCVCVSIR